MPRIREGGFAEFSPPSAARIKTHRMVAANHWKGRYKLSVCQPQVGYATFEIEICQFAKWHISLGQPLPRVHLTHEEALCRGGDSSFRRQRTSCRGKGNVCRAHPACGFWASLIQGYKLDPSMVYALTLTVWSRCLRGLGRVCYNSTRQRGAAQAANQWRNAPVVYCVKNERERRMCDAKVNGEERLGANHSECRFGRSRMV